MIPKNCHLWQNKNLKWEDFKWEVVKTYWEYSHDWRYLIKCEECGQLYINDNVEKVDWLGGNDKIFTTIVPVSGKELEERDFSNILPTELLKFSPVLLLGSDNNLKWIDTKNESIIK